METRGEELQSWPPTEPPRVAAALVEEDPIHSTVLELNRICKGATLDFAMAVGECVVRRVYGGDVDLFRSRTHKKDMALRSLARHPDLAMSATSLYHSVAVYELCDRLSLRTYRHISAGHIRLVLPLAPDTQARLLQAAEANRWPMQRLDEEVSRLEPTQRSHSRGGQRRSSALLKAVRKVDRAIAKMSEALSTGDGAAGGDPTPDSVREALTMVQKALTECGRVEARLNATIPGARSEPPPPLVTVVRACGSDRGS
ncbi:MAG: hypothetical protein JOZ69_00695 [Myxococcales bacterium]|nr:hypothetical protein [Myxococcales bacterium]